MTYLCTALLIVTVCAASVDECLQRDFPASDVEYCVVHSVAAELEAWVTSITNFANPFGDLNFVWNSSAAPYLATVDVPRSVVSIAFSRMAVTITKQGACCIMALEGTPLQVTENTLVYEDCINSPSPVCVGTRMLVTPARARPCTPNEFGEDVCRGTTKQCTYSCDKVDRSLSCRACTVTNLRAGSSTLQQNCPVASSCPFLLSGHLTSQPLRADLSVRYVQSLLSSNELAVVSAITGSISDGLGFEVHASTALLREVLYSATRATATKFFATYLSIVSYVSNSPRLLEESLGALVGEKRVLVERQLRYAGGIVSLFGLAAANATAWVEARRNSSGFDTGYGHLHVLGVSNCPFLYVVSLSVDDTKTQTPSPTHSSTRTPSRSFTLSQSRSHSTTRTPSATINTLSSLITGTHSALRSNSSTVSLVPPRVQTLPGLQETLKELLGDKTAATATSVTAATAVATVGILLPSSTAGYANRLGGITKVADCGFAYFVDGENAVPDAMELPLHTELGTSRLRHFAGGVVLTSLVAVALPAFLLTALHGFLFVAGGNETCRDMLASIQKFWIGTAYSLCMSFFAPTVLGSSVMLLFYSNFDTYCFLAAAVGILVCSVCTLPFGWWLLQLKLAAPPQSNKGANDKYMWDFSNPSQVTMWCLGEGTAQPWRLALRMYFFEELGVSCSVAVLTNVPPLNDSCSPLAIMMLTVTALHVAYLVVCRPYYSTMQLCFSLFNSFAQLATSALILMTVAVSQSYASVVPWLVLCQLYGFAVQLVLALIRSIIVSQRRQFAVDASNSVDTEMPILNPLPLPPKKAKV